MAAKLPVGHRAPVAGELTWLIEQCAAAEKAEDVSSACEQRIAELQEILATAEVVEMDVTAAVREANCPREDLKFILYCGFHAGLRKLEIIEARPFWFDLDAGLLHLRKTPTIRFKDREERTVPLTQEFKTFLKEYGLRDPFMLAPSVPHGKSKYRHDFLRPFTAYMTEKKVPWVTPHIMRHTFASLLASQGTSIYKIAKSLGDDVRVVDKVYAKLAANDSDIEVGAAATGKSPRERRSHQPSKALTS